MEWTPSAREAFDRYFERERDHLVRAGADPAEVKEDFRRHFEETWRKKGLTVVTEEEIRRHLLPLGLGTSFEPAKPPKRRIWRESFLALGGVLLPLLAFFFELFGHVTAGVAFDPIPNLGFAVLVLFVPLMNAASLHLLGRSVAPPGRAHAFGIGLATGVAGIYALLYLPLVPVSVIGALFMGIGLLGLTPFTAFLASAVLRRRVLRAGGAGTKLMAWAGVASGIAVFLLLNVGQTATRLALSWASSDDPATRLRGVACLRAWGDEEDLLRRCYFEGRGGGGAPDILGYVLSWGEAVSAEEARGIFHRVTGSNFESRPRPPIRSGLIGPRWPDDEAFEFDDAQGTLSVGARLSRLRLESSRLDASCDPEAALGYTEWTMIFRNDHRFRQGEARAILRLPPGGVVSRLTLWVNDEPREAAFAGRGKTAQAYQAVVQQRRDPVLVTTKGRDRVLVQCFPIPPAGGSMRIRIGITAPLAWDETSAVRPVLPYIEDRNFGISSSLRHSVWIESGDSSVERTRRDLAEAELRAGGALPAIARDPRVVEVWSPRNDAGPGVVRGILSSRRMEPPDRLVVVLDGSVGMKDHAETIARFLSSLPGELDLRLLFVDDARTEGVADAEIARATPGEAAARVRAAEYAGGQRIGSSIAPAWDLAAEARRGMVLVLHGPQPGDPLDFEGLRQRLERSPDGPEIHDLFLGAGPDPVLSSLDGFDRVRTVRDLEEWRRGRMGGETIPVFEWSLAAAPARGAVRTSPHLARLWAAAEVERLATKRTAASDSAALLLASRAQIVTSVSGAVVLENAAQYDAAGLAPVDPASVPTIPEPRLVWLLFVVAVAVVLERRRAARA